MRRQRMVIGVVVLLAACSSGREARPITRPAPPTSVSSVPATNTGPLPSTASSTAASGGAASTSSTSAPPTSTAATREVTGVAVAGSAGRIEAGGPPFARTDPFSEAVRLRDGSCVGWAESRGGSTAGLRVGAPVVILEAEANKEIGSGMVQSSRWVDMADGGKQWNCLFDFTATVTGAPAEFRIRVGNLQPWLARPDPAAPETFVASVNTDASIGLIPSCPEVTDPAGTAATTTVPRRRATRPARMVSGWNAVGQYWSRGVASLCKAGLPVTAIARPCRPPGFGSEYIAAVVDSADSTVTYRNGAKVRAGTEVTVVVATGRLCEPAGG